MQQRNEIIALGKVIGFHGVRGWVKIFSDCRPRENIFHYKNLLLLDADGKTTALKLKEGKAQGKGLIALYEGINSRDDISAILNKQLGVYRHQLPILNDNEYYWQDLIGMTAINRQGEILGRVVKIIETGANDVLIIKHQRGNQILVPLIISYYLDKVDYENQHIYLDWQEEWSAVSASDKHES